MKVDGVEFFDSEGQNTWNLTPVAPKTGQVLVTTDGEQGTTGWINLPQHKWCPLVNYTHAVDPPYVITIYRVETGLGDSLFQWGNLREIESKEVLREPFIRTVGDELEITFWALKLIEPNTLEISVQPLYEIA